jgi:uncharacterized protein YybS (DUF2232 family)
MLTMMFFIVSVFFPLIGFFCTLFVPLPILYFRAKLGRKIGAIVPVAALGVMAATTGGISADILMFFMLLFLGFIIGEVMEKNLPVDLTVFLPCAGVWVAGFAGLVVFSGMHGNSLTAMVSDYVRQNLELTLQLYDKMGMPQEHIHTIQRSMDAIEYGLVRILPGLAAVFLLVMSWMNLLMARPLFLRKGLFYPQFGPLMKWKAPEILVWAVIACGILLLLPARPIKMIGFNGLLILMTVFFFEGIAIVSFFFDKKRLPGMVRIFLYSLIALQQIILLLVIGLGFFDMWINFRKLGKNDSDPG